MRPLLLAAFALSASATLAAWPEKPVRIIVPSAPGGGTDSSIRILAPRLSELLGQVVLVDNRAGASGNIGAEVVARAVPDGYTLLAAIASHTSNPAMMKVSYDVLRDFEPVSMTVTVPNVLIALPHIRGGRVRAYGVTSLKRIASAPDIPTLAESGVAGFEAVQWFGVFAPAGTPGEIISTLHGGIVKALQDPVVRERFMRDGAEPTPSASSQAFTALVRSEVARWQKLVAAAGLKPQ